MLWTGFQDCNLQEARQFVIEKVAALPVFDVSFYGRLLMITTPGVDFGIWYGGATDWFHLVHGASRVKTYEFVYWNYPANNPVELSVWHHLGAKRALEFPTNGQILVVELFLSLPITAGSVLIKPQLNDLDLPATDLDTTISGSGEYNSSSVVFGNPNFEFTTSDKLGVVAAGNTLTLPTSIHLSANVLVALN